MVVIRDAPIWIGCWLQYWLIDWKWISLIWYQRSNPVGHNVCVCVMVVTDRQEASVPLRPHYSSQRNSPPTHAHRALKGQRAHVCTHSHLAVLFIHLLGYNNMSEAHRTLQGTRRAADQEHNGRSGGSTHSSPLCWIPLCRHSVCCCLRVEQLTAVQHQRLLQLKHGRPADKWFLCSNNSECQVVFQLKRKPVWLLGSVGWSKQWKAVDR